MTTTKNSTINRRVAAKISHMTSEEARDLLASLIPKTIEQPLIRELTGGYASQSINFSVTRKLGIKAGYIRNLR